MRRAALVYGLLTMVFWSSAFVGIRVGLRAFSPFHLVLLRFLTASVVLLAGVLIRGGRLIPPRRVWLRVAMSGVAGFTLYHTALTLGERTVNANTASFIVAAAPLFSAVLGRIFLKERLASLAWLGMLISFAGVGVLSGVGGGIHWNALLIILSALSTAAYFVLEKPLLMEFPALDVTAWVTWAGTISMLLYGKGFVDSLIHAPAYPLLMVIYIGIFPAAVAYVTWSLALRNAPVGEIAPLLYLNPILASILAWLMLGERPGWSLMAGGIMILAGVWIIQVKSKMTQGTEIREARSEYQ